MYAVDQFPRKDAMRNQPSNHIQHKNRIKNPVKMTQKEANPLAFAGFWLRPFKIPLLAASFRSPAMPARHERRFTRIINK
jgi:hypothetical protein